MQPAKYIKVVTDAIDYLAGWQLCTSSEIIQTARIVADMLGDCRFPRMNQPKLFKAFILISIAMAVLHNGSNGRLPIRKAVSLANEYLIMTLSILLK